MRLLLCLGALLVVRAAPAEDCNRNGIEDGVDLEEVSPGLSPRARLAAPRGSSGIALADMDRDGLLDLVAHFEPMDDTHELLVLLSPEPWKLSATHRLGVGDQTPTDFAVGDIDGDGDPDVVTLTGPGASVHRNVGGGKLETVSPIVIGAAPASVALGDLDGDGLLDIATANSSEPDGGIGNVSVAINDGNASFLLARNYASGGLGLALLGGDFDGDLDVDLALTLREPESTITVLLNDGGGAFLDDARSDPSLFPYPFIHHLVGGDLDGNGDLDLVVTSPDGGASLHWNGGAAIFVTAEALAPGAADQPAVIEDLDGDGDLDVALALKSCPEVEVFSNDGGSFGDSRRFPVERPSTALAGAVLLRAGDLDGDGDPDVAAMGKRSISLLENAAAGTSADCNGNLIPDDCEVDCDGNGIPDECDLRDGAGDCDHDGLLDACDTGDADASSLPDGCEIASSAAIDCDGNGRIDTTELEPFLAFPRLAGEPYLRIDTISAGDLDGDGTSELVVSADGALRLLRARSLDLAKGFLETRLVTAPVTTLELADWDADGDLDIGAAGPQVSCDKGDDAIALVFRNGGSADLAEAEAHGVSSPVPASARGGDLDGDGKLDLLLFRPQEGVSWLKGMGGLVFEDESLALSAPGGLAIASKGMIAADLDGDRDTDLALSGGGVYLQEGPLEFRRSFELPPGPIDGGDLDGDADVDLLLGNTLFRNDFGGVFSPLTELGPRADGVLVADLDGDGKDDAALSAAGRLDVFFQRGVDLLEPARFHPLTASSDSRLAAGDLNGDGFVDIAAASGGLGLITLYPGRPPFETGAELNSAGLVVSMLVSVRAGDLDGDGDDDLVAVRVADPRQPLEVLRASGGRLERGPVPPTTPPASIALADMDSDGDRDLLLATGGFATLGRNAGDGSFFLAEAIQLTEDLRAANPADLDGDGDLDIVGEEPNGVRFPMAFRSGAGLARGPIGEIGVASRFVLLPDTEGDGDADLVAAAEDGILVRENDGSGRFAPDASLDAGGPAAAGIAGDWNGDGTPDIAVALGACTSCSNGSGCNCGALAILLNGGAAGFGNAFRIELPGAAASLAAGDLDRDGDLDLVAPLVARVRPETFSAALVLLGDGDGGFARWGIVPALERPRAAALGDIDGDGYLDIAIASDIGLTVHRSRAEPPPGIDADGDGRLDACGKATFRRGDWNQDAALDITDAITILNHLFLGGPAAACLDAGDADDSGDLSITDPVRILRYLFQGETPPAGPLEACGVDPTDDDLGCGVFAPCN